MKLTDFKIGDKVRSVDEPEPGIVLNIDHEQGMVIVDFKVNGAYDHPGGVVDVDPLDLAKIEEPWCCQCGVSGHNDDDPHPAP